MRRYDGEDQDMTLELVGIVLLAALFNACWNAIIKVSGDRLSVMGAVTLVGSVASLFALPFVEVPDRAAWPYLALTIVLHTGYHFLLPQAYRFGQLGLIYPLTRGSAPLLVTAASALFVGESLSTVPLVGIVCLSAGVMSLALDRSNGMMKNPKAVLWALITGASIASYTVVDGVGARMAGSVFGFAVILTIGDGLLTSAIIAVSRPRSLLSVFRTNGLACCAGGLMQVGAYWIAVYALANAPMGMVSALRETSVLFGALISTFVLREGLGVWRFFAATLVVAGVALMRNRP